MPGTSISVVIDTPVKTIYDVVVDFESYPEFLSDLKAAHVEKKKPLTVSFDVHLIKKIKYSLSFNLVPNKKVEWELTEGDLFKKNSGSWTFKELKKNQTEATYNIDVAFGFLVPSLITNKLIGRSLPDMMQKFEKRAESL